MDRDRWKKIKTVFAETSELSRDERSFVLTGLDADLRIEVERLLESYAEAHDFIEQPARARFLPDS